MIPRTVVLDISFFQREPGTFKAIDYGDDTLNSIRTLVRANIDYYDKCAITDVPKLLTRFSKLEPPVYICDSTELQVILLLHYYMYYYFMYYYYM